MLRRHGAWNWWRCAGGTQSFGSLSPSVWFGDGSGKSVQLEAAGGGLEHSEQPLHSPDEETES